MNSANHIATRVSNGADDLDYAPFSRRDGLSKAHQLFGEQRPALLGGLKPWIASRSFGAGHK